MYSIITSGTVFGIDGILIQVEVDVSPGLPVFHIVGGMSTEVHESTERIRTALRNCGFSLPPQRMIVNLSPADIKKSGTGFDLPIAIGLLVSMGVIAQETVERIAFIGELGLDGKILPVNGVLPIVEHLKGLGYEQFVVPTENVGEALSIQGCDVFATEDLTELVDCLINPMRLDEIMRVPEQDDAFEGDNVICDFSELKGQKLLRRALEISASGMHNVLMVGPPGAGKSLAAKCLTGILPKLTFEESIELTKIYSVRGMMGDNKGLIENRPFRSPHHTISSNSLIGGGAYPIPGEISLAHRGVLFLDELPEFSKATIEVLRQPLEDRHVLISRLSGIYDFPAKIMLVGAMNPCPCGNYPNRNKCNCSIFEIKRYQNRISKAILDRIDLQLRIEPVLYKDMISKTEEEDSKTIRKRVLQAQTIQKERYKNESFLYNSELDNPSIKKYCALTKEEEDFLETVFYKHNLSGRGYYRILKLARTIADMDAETDIKINHLMEATAYRIQDSFLEPDEKEA